MPTGKLPSEQSPGHHRHQENMPRTTLFPCQKVADVPQGDRAGNGQVAVKPPNTETQQEEARPAKMAVAPPKNEMPEFEDVDLEEEIVKMQITIETELKRGRLKKVEVRRRQTEISRNG